MLEPKKLAFLLRCSNPILKYHFINKQLGVTESFDIVDITNIADIKLIKTIDISIWNIKFTSDYSKAFFTKAHTV